MDAYTEANNDAREAEAFWWREQHSGCDVEPCAECLAIEQMDADAYQSVKALHEEMVPFDVLMTELDEETPF